MITTRQATPNDAKEVQSVIDAAFATVRDVYQPKPDAVTTSENANLDSKTIVALINEEIVGAITVYQDATALHVSQLAVVEKFRKRGVARALMQSANEAAIECGANHLALNTIQETGNVAIFQRLGFIVDTTTEATWCISERFPQLHDVSMNRPCNS